tara:strand:- start:9509 stop:9622 length:114 start_codon:yes stop_codon:yes gene_type:complete
LYLKNKISLIYTMPGVLVGIFFGSILLWFVSENSSVY